MPVCTAFIQPLNLECLFINTFAETTNIFVFLSYFVIASLAGMFRMNNLLTISMMLIWTIIMIPIVGSLAEAFLLLAIVMISFTVLKWFFKTVLSR